LNNSRQGTNPAALASGHDTGPPDHHNDEARLLRQIARGDREAMAQLYRLHSKIVLAQIILTVGDRSLAEEILQDTMLAVWRGADTFRGESSVRSWMISIARRQARDRLRRHRPRLVSDALLTEQPSPDPGPDLIALERAEITEVADAIRVLAPAHREVFGLVFGAGLSLPEAAEVLEIPLGTVKSRLAAARAALSRALNQKGQG
jgi:RNA polymerase sigma-70 factor, ECF subfamily